MREPDGTFVKICGITTVTDARAAMRAGANALGFLFAPSPRRISLRRAAQITRHIHPSVMKFGVFVDAEPGVVEEHVAVAGLDAVQMQGAETPAAIRALRRLLPGVFIAKVIRATGPDSLDRGADYEADAIFFDPKDPSRPLARRGPVPIEWLGMGAGPRLVVAGGLTARNVGRLIRDVRPWGVDVSSGVEAHPGRKDRAKLSAFIAAVRRADSGGRVGPGP